MPNLTKFTKGHAVNTKPAKGHIRITKYIERNPIKKQQFNDTMLEKTKSFLKKNPRDKYDIFVMDAAMARSTNTIIASGLKNRVVAFSNNPSDVKAMKVKEKILADADSLYDSDIVGEKCVVWHDGTYAADRAFEQIVPLFRHGRKSIGLGCNVSMRTKKYGTFARRVSNYARLRGYECKGEKLKSYNQGGGPYQPFWFNITLK